MGAAILMGCTIYNNYFQKAEYEPNAIPRRYDDSQYNI
jgi:hypothetical protein